MEIVVAVPVAADAPHQHAKQHQLAGAPDQGTTDRRLAVAAVEGSHGHERCRQNIIRYIVSVVLLVDDEEGQPRPPDVLDARLVEHEIIVVQGPEDDAEQSDDRGHHASGGCHVLQPPRQHDHEQRRQQSVEADERIEYGGAEHHIERTHVELGGQQPVEPHAGHGHGGADGSGEEVAAQLQVVNPVAQVDVGNQQGRHGDEQHQAPLHRDAERAPEDGHEQRPPQAEQRDA